MAEAQKSREKTAVFLEAWGAQQKRTGERLGEILSMKAGEMVIENEARRVLEQHRAELEDVFASHLHPEEANSIRERGVFLLKREGFNAEANVPDMVAMTGKEHKFRIAQITEAAEKAINYSDENTDQDKAIVHLLSGEMMLDSVLAWVKKDESNFPAELVKAWEARQEKTSEQMKNLDGVLDKVLAVSKRDGRRALAERMLEMITKEKEDVYALFNGKEDELDVLKRKGIALLVENGLAEEHPQVAFLAVGAGDKSGYLLLRVTDALNNVCGSDAYSGEEKKVAQLVASEMCNGIMLNACKGQVRNIRLSGILRKPWGGKERESKREEIKSLIRNAESLD